MKQASVQQTSEGRIFGYIGIAPLHRQGSCPPPEPASVHDHKTRAAGDCGDVCVCVNQAALLACPSSLDHSCTMASRVASLRRAAALSRRAMSSLEASTSGRPTSSAAASWLSQDASTSPSVPSAARPWLLAPPPGSRLLSSLGAEQAAEPRQATYYVEVITGDVRGAESSVPAAITLFGEGACGLHLPHAAEWDAAVSPSAAPGE